MQDARRSPHRGLPTPADLFVGRDGELVAVAGMLADARARLVTLTGPPGIGKTRLALACASAYAERSQCPPVFVDLAPVRDPALVMAELAQAAGVEPRSGADLTGQLAAALGNEERLVVLDNFEHLLGAPPDVGQVLAACPRLRVLATSRERLRLSVEQQHFVTHRLNHYRAGLRMDYATTTAGDLATAMRTALARSGTGLGYRKVPRGGRRTHRRPAG